MIKCINIYIAAAMVCGLTVLQLTVSIFTGAIYMPGASVRNPWIKCELPFPFSGSGVSFGLYDMEFDLLGITYESEYEDLESTISTLDAFNADEYINGIEEFESLQSLAYVTKVMLWLALSLGVVATLLFGVIALSKAMPEAQSCMSMLKTDYLYMSGMLFLWLEVIFFIVAAAVFQNLMADGLEDFTVGDTLRTLFSLVVAVTENFTDTSALDDFLAENDWWLDFAADTIKPCSSTSDELGFMLTCMQIGFSTFLTMILCIFASPDDVLGSSEDDEAEHHGYDGTCYGKTAPQQYYDQYGQPQQAHYQPQQPVMMPPHPGCVVGPSVMPNGYGAPYH